MSSVNKQILLGRLGKDPDIKAVGEKQTVVCKFSVATSEKYNGVETTTWHNVVVWGKQAENCGKYLAKGRLVYLEGRTENRKYTDKQGVEKYITEVIADQVRFLPDGARKAEVGTEPTVAADDIPF